RRAVPALVSRVADDIADGGVVADKTAALAALRVLGPERVGGALTEAWRANSSAQIRTWAARHLADSKELLSHEDRRGRGRRPAERVVDPQPNASVFGDKTAALKTLRALGPDQAKEALERARRSPNPSVVKWAERQ